ncbi:nucleotidyltransferase family protein [Aromatoleum anaerobium]
MAPESVRAVEPVVGILLAAGCGSRFGGDKLLHPLPDGTPIGVRSAMNLRDGIETMVALVRPDDVELRRRLERAGIECVVSENAAEGMGSTIACGGPGDLRRSRMGGRTRRHAPHRSPDYPGRWRCTCSGSRDCRTPGGQHSRASRRILHGVS